MLAVEEGPGADLRLELVDPRQAGADQLPEVTSPAAMR
jgi:hypothetical protein